jgi:hypothetical protein
MSRFALYEEIKGWKTIKIFRVQR